MFIAVVVATLLAYLGVLVVNAIIASSAERRTADRAVVAARTIATNAHNRITEQGREINQLKRQLARASARRSRQLGHLQTSVLILARQLRRHHLVPNVVVHRTTRIIHAPTVKHHAKRHRTAHATASAPSPAATVPTTGNGKPIPGKAKGRHKPRR